MSETAFQNQLLRSLTETDLAVVAPLLRHVDMPRHMKLDEPSKDIDTVYFLEQGICSIVVIGEHDQKTEAGLIGRDGMVGFTLAAETSRSPHQTFMQVSGHGLAMSSADFQTCLTACPSLRTAALRYGQALYTQVSHTLLATARNTIHQRLARWLLMCQDRVDGNDLELTHEFLALMLTVRRSGVTNELHVLEGMHLIRSLRGLVQVIDRAGLVRVADGSYGLPEREYDRLFPGVARQPADGAIALTASRTAGSAR